MGKVPNRMLLGRGPQCYRTHPPFSGASPGFRGHQSEMLDEGIEVAIAEESAKPSSMQRVASNVSIVLRTVTPRARNARTFRAHTPYRKNATNSGEPFSKIGK
jgi:hypothetical protein